MNDNDTLSGPDSSQGHITGETITGEHDGHAAAAPQQAKNKSNIKFFAILAVVVLVVLVMGYMAFGHRKHAVPQPSVPANTSPSANALAPSAPTSTPTASPTLAPTAPTLAPAAPALTSQEQANALLGEAPLAPTAAPAATASVAPSSLPSALQPAAPALPVNPAATPTPSAVVPANPALASTSALPANPALVTAPAQPSVTAPESAATSALPAVLNPASAAPVQTAQANPPSSPAQVASTPVTPSATVSLESRVSDLETRLSNLEAGQARIVDILAHMNPPTKAAPKEPSAAVSKHVRHRRHSSDNVVKVLPKESSAKPVPVTHAPILPAGASCHLASIVPNRAWTKQPDGTFMTYGIGDRAPNGGIIKAIDPDRGIITDKGKQVCPMVD